MFQPAYMNSSSHTQITAKALSGAARQSFFPAELPVSYDTAGNVASRFGDLVWNMSSMSTDGTSPKNLSFYNADSSVDPNLGSLLREQQKALMWLHMDAGRTRAFNTLQSTNYAMLTCCKAASDRGVNLYSLLTNPDWALQTARGMNPLYVDHTASVLRTLWRHREQLDAPSNFPYQYLRSILNKEARSRPEYLQTPLIPSLVYCNILAALGSRMDVIEHELEALLDAYAKDHEARNHTPQDQKQSQKFRAGTMAETAERMKELGYKPTQAKSLKQFIATRIKEHKLVLMLVVAAYTGMRVGEVSNLPLDDVLVEFDHMGAKHYELHGSTHKLNKGVKRSTTWITSSQGARAVRLAQRIARSVQKQYKAPAKKGQHTLLYPSPKDPFKALSKSTISLGLKIVRSYICPVIKPSDLEELDRLELARGWARDDIV